MSTHYHVFCATCEEEGPHIRRSPGGTGLLADHRKGLQSQAGMVAENAWNTFLIDHSYHDLHLLQEGQMNSQCACLRDHLKENT